MRDRDSVLKFMKYFSLRATKIDFFSTKVLGAFLLRSADIVEGYICFKVR